MSQLLENLLFGFGVIDLVFAVSILHKEQSKEKDNRWFSAYAFCLSIWSISFGYLSSAETVETAYIFRSIGMFGMFGSMICVTALFTALAHLPKKTRSAFLAISISGLIIYPFNIRKEFIAFTKTDWGMTYTYVLDAWSYIFVIYTALMVGMFIHVIVYMMIKLQKKRYKKTGHLMFSALFTMACGNIIDTILPMLGSVAIPASTILSFACCCIAYAAVDYSNKNRVSLANVAGYIFHSVKTSILIYNEKSELILVSDEASKLLSIDRDRDYSGLHIDDLFEWEVEEFPPDEKTKTFEASIRGQDKVCSIEINKVFDYYEDLLGYVVIISDMTERARIMSELESARRKADEANHAKSAFLANMSHEIRTPINTVLGMNEMIRRENDSPADVLKYSEDIRVAGESLLSIINDILDFSKVEAGMMEITEGEYMLRPLLSGIINMFSLKAVEKGLEFHVSVDKDLPSRLLGDEVRIRQVLINLLSNAVKYTLFGSVSLVVYGRPKRKDYEFTFEIIDTGIGIRKEDIGSLFNSFSRLDEMQTHHIEGTGLGLSIVKELTRLMGASLEVESDYGRGSTFRFIITQKMVDISPVGVIDENDIVNIQKEYKESFVAPDARILVVDDNIMNLEVIKGLLKKTGVRIDTAESGKDALDLVRRNKYHVILLDHMMPIMDGIEVMKQMKKMEAGENLSAGAVVIALTANAVHGARDFYLENGFDGYLSKPVQSEELEQTIRNSLPAELIGEAEENGRENGEEEGMTDPKEVLLSYGINLKNGLTYCSTMDIYRITAETFCKMAEESCEKLADFRKAEDVENYRILIHGIKSNARTLGCNSLFEYALAQENSCKEGDFEPIKQDGARPEEMIRKVVKGLVAAFGITTEAVPVAGEEETGNASNSGVKEEELSEETKEKIASAISFLEEFDAEGAEEVMKELEVKFVGTSRAQKIKAAIEKLSVYDYDAAADILKVIV